MINVVIGRLGKDAEVFETSNGTKCVKFSVAENNYRNGEEKTTWYDVTSYDSFVLNSQIKVLKKGTFVVIVGDVDSRINVGKDGKVYLNHSVIPSAIKIPNIGTSNRSESTTNNGSTSSFEAPSVSLEGLNSVKEETSSETLAKPEAKTRKKKEVVVATASNSNEDDDLPF